MQRIIFTAVTLIATGSVTITHSAADEPDDLPFRIEQVRTELHRRFLGEETDWYVIVHPAAMAVDGDIPDDAQGWKDLAQALKSSAQEQAEESDDDNRSGVYLQFVFDVTFTLSRNSERFHRRATEVIQDAGFQVVRVENQFDSRRWREKVADLDDSQPPDSMSSEPESRSKTVSVYPVRTPLGRYLTGGSDCLVDFRNPLEESGGVVAPESLDEAITLVTRLELDRRKKILFNMNGKVDTKRGNSVLEAAGIPDELPADLGFETSSIRH